MKRLPPSEVSRQKIRELLAQRGERENPISELMRLSMEAIIERTLEAKLRDLLGRGYYDHAGQVRDYRNGYREGRLKGSEGEVRYAVPQSRRGEAAAV